jgi:hypothetical protein
MLNDLDIGLSLLKAEKPKLTPKLSLNNRAKRKS